MPIRIEDGGFPYTTLKTKLHSTLRIESSVDHTVLHGQGIVSLHASIDHFKDEHKFGVAFKLQH